MYGQGGNDLLNGRVGDDTVDGGEGDDQVYGEDGAGVLSGGNGNDGLYGSFGTDTMTGGAGNDRFWQLNSAADTLTDFAAGDVVLHLSQDPADSVTGSTMTWTDGEVRALDSTAAILQAAAGGRTTVFADTAGTLPFRLVKENTLPGNAVGYNWVRTLGGATVGPSTRPSGTRTESPPASRR